MFIYPRDAADLKLCLPIPSFLLTKAEIRIHGLNGRCTLDLFLPPISVTRERESTRKAGRPFRDS